MTRRALCLILPSLVAAASAEGIAKLVTYRSPVDNSDQAYGVYLPDGAPPPEGYPVVLHAHGYGWAVDAGFSDWQKRWADAHRWMLVQLNARGPNFYWGIGDVATREVIDDLDLRFGIDRKRVYITGGSMGGTGAFRQGVVHPDVIAAAVGVDGWTDYREWHWHWYARKDMRDDIEEFRRPLLEAASPVYVAERARWGDVYVIADDRDDVVYPWQGVDLARRLHELKLSEAGAYESGLTLHRDRGHGGGYDLGWIYDYFLGRSARPERGEFRIATTVLDHGEMYWGRIERLHHQGQKATLECSATICDGIGVVNALTANLDRLSLHIALSPVAEQPVIRVYVDGIPVYSGPPQELVFEAQWDTQDELSGWTCLTPPPAPVALTREEAVSAPSAAVAQVPSLPSAGRGKTPEICGPIGHAFLSPFIVCYGSLGSPEDIQRHREEADAFAAGWNGFMVHGDAVRAVSEETLAEWDIRRANLVVYGTLDTSRLLRRADALDPLPVRPYADYIVVRDPLCGDREYRGRKFGLFLVYPNPLTQGRTYLVVCSGRFATQPDGSSRQGLEFDLEKLSWAYSDYVIFNTDLGDLAHVMNVNNKPPVTCYEPGYFVEAGYFDADWQPDRFVTLDRVRRTSPPRARRVHVADVSVEETTLSVPVPVRVDGPPQDPPRSPLDRPVLVAKVRIADHSGSSVVQARVTGRWLGLDCHTLSRATLSDGVAYFPCPLPPTVRPWPRFQVLNVMATGAVYDFPADVLWGGVWEDAAGIVAARPTLLRQRVDPQCPTEMALDLRNLTDEPQAVVATFIPPHGQVRAEEERCTLGPGEQARRAVIWEPEEGLPGGSYRGIWQVQVGEHCRQLPVELLLSPPRRLPVLLLGVEGRDIIRGEPFEIKAKLRSLDWSRELTVSVACSVLEAGLHLPPRELELTPGESGEVTWRPEPDTPPLPPGEYRARVTVLGAQGVSGACAFAVRGQ